MKKLSFADFLEANASEINKKLGDISNPSFKGLANPELYREELFKLASLPRKLFAAQAQMVVAGANHLAKYDSLLVSSEMGTGKTIMGIALSYLLYGDKKAARVAIMSPSHLVPKWASEIQETLGDLCPFRIIIIKSYKDLIGMGKPKGLEFLLFSKETAKLSYPRSELDLEVVLKKITPGLWRSYCPQCGGSIKEYNSEREPKIEGYTEMGDPIQLKRCEKCNSKVKQPAKRAFHLTPKGVKKFHDIKAADRKLSVAEYIAGRDWRGGRLDMLIADEVHELKGGTTAQGSSFGLLASRAKKVVGLTGTLLNGYASSLFYILFRMSPKTMLDLGYGIRGVNSFVADYGANEVSFSESPEVEEVSGKITRMNRAPRVLKEIARINPLLVKELMPFTIFLRSDELNIALPRYKEEVVGVRLPDEIYSPYISYIREVAGKCVKNKRLLGVLATDSQLIPDLFWQSRVAVANNIVEATYSPPVLDDDFISPKEEALIELVRNETAQGRKCLVYVSFSNCGVGDRVRKLLDEALSDKVVESLNASIAADKREAWIKGHPCDVLVANPELVKTGLDLLEYPSIVFYETGYNTNTLRQASRRAWRIGQREDCKVFFMTYVGTPQEVALKLMSRKIKAANSIEGRLISTSSELGAFAAETTIQDQIAQAILNNSEDKEAAETEYWEFKEREWNVFEKFYMDIINTPQNAPQAEIVEAKVEMPKAETIEAPKVAEKAIETKEKSNVSIAESAANIAEKRGGKTLVYIRSGKKEQAVEMTKEDILNYMSNGGGLIQPSLFDW